MFGKNWLVCVFSYNRGEALQNLFVSVHSFYPEWNVVVFDDCSNDAATVKILDKLREQGITILLNNTDTDGSKHGGLYAQMNNALKYACDSGCDYAYFVQDDMQFLWRDEVLEERVKAAFAHPECIMCNSSFLQKILTEGIAERMPEVKPGLFSFDTYGVTDTGIIDIGKAKIAGLNFPEQSEGGNGRYWYNMGYRLYWLPHPHLAWVPWPPTFRNKQKENRKAKLLLPLSDQAINRLEQNYSYAYLEDYTSLTKYMIKPYWYTSNPGRLSLLKIYLKYYLKRLIG